MTPVQAALLERRRLPDDGGETDDRCRQIGSRHPPSRYQFHHDNHDTGNHPHGAIAGGEQHRRARPAPREAADADMVNWRDEHGRHHRDQHQRPVARQRSRWMR